MFGRLLGIVWFATLAMDQEDDPFDNTAEDDVEGNVDVEPPSESHGNVRRMIDEWNQNQPTPTETRGQRIWNRMIDDNRSYDAGTPQGLARVGKYPARWSPPRRGPGGR